MNIKKKWYSENKNKIKAKHREYRRKNRDKILKGKKKYREENREKCYQQYKNWVGNNPEKYKSIQQKYTDIHRDEINKRRLDSYYKNHSENKKKSRKFQAKKREQLHDSYLIQKVKRDTGLDYKTVKSHPEILKTKRMQIKVKRLLKNKNDENTETS